MLKTLASGSLPVQRASYEHTGSRREVLLAATFLAAHAAGGMAVGLNAASSTPAGEGTRRMATRPTKEVRLRFVREVCEALDGAYGRPPTRPGETRDAAR